MNATPAQALVPVDEQERSRVLARERQRRRRMGRQRVDYYPDGNAIRVIEALRTGHVGGDASSIINLIITAWWEGPGPA